MIGDVVWWLAFAAAAIAWYASMALIAHRVLVKWELDWIGEFMPAHIARHGSPEAVFERVGARGYVRSFAVLWPLAVPASYALTRRPVKQRRRESQRKP